MILGVPYGRGVDIHALLSEIEIARVPSDTESEIWHIVFSADALPAVESLCFARYWNFQRIYWHHTNRALAAMIIRTIREVFATDTHNIQRYLEETRDLGESGSLQYLAEAYKKLFGRPSPLEGLASNRNMIYRRLFEMSFHSHTELFPALQSKENGAKNREKVELRILECVKNALVKYKLDSSIESNEVLLDVPLRKMDLGGMIWIRKLDGTIGKATLISSALKDLEHSFEMMGKILRVFVSTRIQERFGDFWLEVRADMREKIISALVRDDSNTEIR